MPVQFLPVVELSNLNGQNGFKINGVQEFDASGSSVSNAGDVNNDGITDLLIGAAQASPGNPSLSTRTGASYVVFGKSGIGNNGIFELSTLNGNNGFVINGADPNDLSGQPVSGISDINADGIADFIIPVWRRPLGVSYVIFGKTGIGINSPIELSNFNSTLGFEINAAANDYTGWSVSSAGDVNADGINDLIIDARYGSPAGRPNAGKSYIVFGRPHLGMSGTLELSTLNGTNGFVINGENTNDLSGWSVSGAGDVNNDGVDDVIIGAPGVTVNNQADAGASYVVFGRSGIGGNGTFELANLNGTNGFKLDGNAVASGSNGFSVSGAGDMNGDGIPDLVIGAYDDLLITGSVYVVFGQINLGKNGTLDLSSLNGSDGFRLKGKEGGNFGFVVSIAGDVNADGFSDIIIGAPASSPNGRDSAGITYVVLGHSHIGGNGTLELSSLNGTNGFSLNGVSQGDLSGYYSVSGAGDVNDDGAADIIIGSSSANPGGIRVQAGVSYVVFGSKYPPVFAANHLKINNAQSIILSGDNLNATYFNHDPTALQFVITNLQNGVFELISNPGIPITTFSQQQVWANEIQFTHTGSNLAPSYLVSANDGVVTTAPSTGIITFIPESSSSNSTPAIVGATIGVSVVALTLIGLSSIYTRNKAKQRLEQAIEESGNRDGAFRRNTFSPIVKELYKHLKISGCLGQLDKKTADRFIKAIQTLIEELQKQGMDLNLENMDPNDCQRFLTETVRQIRIQTGISALNCCHFFRAEIKPVQIEDKANAIAKSIHAVLEDTATQRKSSEKTVEMPNIPKMRNS